MSYSERLNDIAILQLNTDGFDKLEMKQKNLTYHLAQAGLYGKFISLDQGSRYNISLFDALISLYEKVDNSNENETLKKQLHDSLFTLFAHNGMYHSMSGERLALPLDIQDLQIMKDTEAELVQIITSILFEEEIQAFRTVQKDDVDVVALSGGNFYENLTTEEVLNFRNSAYPQTESDEVPPYGFNEKIIKHQNGQIERQIISENGLYAKYIKKIIESLEKALEFSENEKQHLAISSLIDFYHSGDAKDFDKHCVAWTDDQSSNIYFINGLIESYEDPLGIGCTFESVVAFKNPIQTAKVEKIIENIQWFEDNSPINQAFKKEKATGLSASSVTVVSMAGDTSPTLPLGVNLPNSDWIRSKHGSKSVNLANVASSRSSHEVQLRQALYLDEYQDVIAQYGNMTNSLHTDLHEIAGHGSGKILEGVNTDSLGAYYSTIEEARADLVALYYMADEKLKEFGVYDNEVDVAKATLAQYITYLTNGAISQLRRVKLGNDLTQAHFRNRQLIALWTLKHADSEKVKMIEKDGKHYIQVMDIEHVRNLFGQLLAEIQRIKSEGDFEAAKNIVMTYGTTVNQTIHQEVLARIEKLNLPNVVGFITPMLVKESDNVVIKQAQDFFKQQLELYKQYK
jgi:dipeptidyl-peptidase III